MISGTAADIGGEVDISVRDNSTDLNGRQLIANARGNSVVFANLYRQHYDSVFRYCVHRLFDRQAALDVTSAVFLKAVQNLHRFSGDEKQFRNWLYKIATNAVNNHLRQAARRSRALWVVGERGNSEMADGGYAADDNAEKVTILKEAMLTLRPRYQTIITLRFFENMKLTEVAEVLGSSPGTIRSQLARALGKLRKTLAPLQEEV